MRCIGVFLSVIVLLSCSLSPTPKFKGIIIPLYVYPTSQEYSKIESLSFSKEVFVVLNPMNGPGVVRDDNYSKKILDLKLKGYKVLGYVYTSYGNRSIHDVTNDIKAWYILYPNIDGIFFDEVSGRVVDLNYYSQCVSYVKKERISSKIVFNPGIFPETSDYFNLANIIVVAEMPQDQFLNEWTKSFEVSPNALCVLIYNVSDYESVFNKSVSENIGYIYITHEEFNNWREVSKYISNLASE